MLNALFFRRLSLLALMLSVPAVPMYAGLVVPQSQWGNTQGGISMLIQNYTGPSDFSIGTSGPSTVTATIASNHAPNSLTPYNGQTTGTVTSYVDQNGAHVYAEGSATGEASVSITAHSGFSDTLYNNNNYAVQFQLGFHLDATLYTMSSARDTIGLNFYQNGYFLENFVSDQILNGAGTYDIINQNFVTQTYTIAPNSSFIWGIDLAAFVGVSSRGDRTYLAGVPYGYLDALNTLSLSSMQAFDTDGNQLSNSVLTSGSGFQYSATAAPEPATWIFSGSALTALLLLRRRIC